MRVLEDEGGGMRKYIIMRRIAITLFVIVFAAACSLVGFEEVSDLFLFLIVEFFLGGVGYFLYKYANSKLAKVGLDWEDYEE